MRIERMKPRPLNRLKRLFGISSGRKAVQLPEEKAEGSFKGCGGPSVFHATLVIFWEFFAWGLMTTPTLNALKVTFPTGTFLYNGVVQGVKGILSFLCAPLIGALSDAWGRKSFLLLTVFFTCAPIPVLLVDSLAYFIAVAISGIFAVTFSVVFSYIADCTNEEKRSFSYGLVSATFAASLVISPTLGNVIIDNFEEHGETKVIALATLVSVLNLAFILFCVPESLPESLRKSSWGSAISWEQADPFASLRKVSSSPGLLRICIVVFLSYLPEAGQYSCFFLYLRQVAGFTNAEVAVFIAVLCVLSVFAQTVVLGLLMKAFGYKRTITIGLGFQFTQLLIYGITRDKVIMCMSGSLAAMSSITYPAISALVSKNAPADQQGVSLGVLTGFRGLCMGLGPAMFGVLFYIFHVDLQSEVVVSPLPNSTVIETLLPSPLDRETLYGAPFLVGAALVLLAMWVAVALKSDRGSKKEDDEVEEESCSSSLTCVSKPKPKPQKKGEAEVPLLDVSDLPQT